MRTNTFFSHRWRRMLRLALIVLLLAPGALTAAPVTSAEVAPPLLQFTAGGHVVGFAPTQVILAAFDHALRIEFVGTAGVTPVAVGGEAALSHGGPTVGRAQPLGIVTYPDLWPGIRVEYRASEGSIVKSTYTVAPGADAGQIRLRYNVPVELQGDGSLQFRFGRGVMSESAPLAWQEIDGRRVFVPAAFALPAPIRSGAGSEVDRSGAGGEVAFRLGAYNPRYPLTIDPNYVWHTFYGSDRWDEGHAIAVDGSGNVYITGRSLATWQGDNNTDPIHPYSGAYDIVVVKLNSAGAYQWHTFYGSSAEDAGKGIAVDGSGSNVYITGWSDITWQGDNDTDPRHAHGGGDWGDIVVLKLNGAGTYQWHTFYGSDSWDYGNGIAVDKSGNVYITGYSHVAWQGDHNANALHAHSGYNDIAMLKLTGAGAYQWHTFYGSTSGDEGRGIAVDGSGNVYITGMSEATWQGEGASPGPRHAHSGDRDIVALKLNDAGAYQWHTFYGSSDREYGWGIAVDGSGNVYITGGSRATWQGDNNTNPLHPYSGNADIVVLKLNGAGAYQWHTFYGSSGGDDSGSGIAVDGSGNIYITGNSPSDWRGDNNTDPLHAHSGVHDIVVLKLTGAGAYRWHTFYGSTSGDGGRGIAVDQNDNVYITGDCWFSWQGDGGANPLHPHSGGGYSDIVVVKLLGTPTRLHRSYLPLVLKGN